ncbi:TIGR01906 family membrane protein [Catenisphaera adipataccumulans]|jgi:integral membrane protein (TIGR01906 family)|uniref:Integral membrane protein (TIGR01906 family) n=1 Tax=Catenisphaera adipataccumulans TaxID=700500 RepID=A0A7W8CYY9_9FIRM|nr:TIGR01906 family membrane protein [Catenisphaera adipataccumulans]MBB5182944.1 integral membrane protein (TIGR01906 family) [Catenisphaera adipataccumulans]
MKKLISFLFGWSIILVILIGSIRFWALRPSFYETLYKQNHLAEQLDVSEQDLNRCIEVLLAYLEDERQDIHCTITKDGRSQEAFDKRERLHMVDVKNLYQNVLKLGNGCLVFALCAFLYLRKDHWREWLSRGILQAGLCFVTIMAFLGIWMATDFNDFWVHFHYVFFPQNDYWILTPGVDFMIDMLPEFVFNALVTRIVITDLIVFAVLFGYCIYYQRRKAPIAWEEEK